jgi:hypothetical protein
VLQPGWSLVLTVTDERGAPLLGAECGLFDEESSQLASGVSDTAGNVHWRDLITSSILVTVRATDREPVLRRIVAPPDGEERLTIALQPASPLEVHVLSADGQPLGDALVTADYASDSDGFTPMTWRARTDLGGVAVLDDFPLDGVMAVQVEAQGHARAHRTVVLEQMTSRQVDFLLAPFATLHVFVRDENGSPQAAQVTLDSWQRDEQARERNLVLKERRDGVPVEGTTGDFVIADAPSGVSITVYAMIGDALVGSARDIELLPGESRAVTITVPEHVPVTVTVRGIPSCEGRIRLVVIDGRLGEPTGPPWVASSGPQIAYEAALDDCRAELLTSRGLYRLSVLDSSGQRIHAEDLEVRGPVAHVVRVDSPLSVSGKLTDAAGRPLAGWTVVARTERTDGDWAGSTRTTTVGSYLIESIPADRVSLYALVPPTGVPARLVEDVALPAEGLVNELPLLPLEIALLDYESGAAATGTVTVGMGGWPWWTPYQAGGRTALVSSGAGIATLSLPAGRYEVHAEDSEGQREGHAALEVAEVGRSVKFPLVRRIRLRFEIDGVESQDTLRWTALGALPAQGELRVSDGSEVDVFIPRGAVQFERVRDGHALGPPIVVEINGGPVVLQW